jgi:hypothetical protein
MLNRLPGKWRKYAAKYIKDKNRKVWKLTYYKFGFWILPESSSRFNGE